jgi:hypothetical protein
MDVDARFRPSRGSLAYARLCRDARGRYGGICKVVAKGVKQATVGAGRGCPMSTTVLAYVILFMGFITFLAGAFGALMLFFEEVSKTGRVPFRYYAMMIGLISGGLGMIGIGQGLRLLLLILGKE